MSATKWETVKNLILTNEFKDARVTNPSGVPVFNYDGESPQDLLERLESIKPVFEVYPYVNLSVGKNGKSNGSLRMVTWKVTFNDSPVTVTGGLAYQAQNPVNQMRDMLQLMGMMQAVMGSQNKGADQNYIDLQIKLVEERHKREMEKIKQDDFSKYAPLLPIALSGLGKSSGEIKELMALSYMAKPGAIAGTPEAVSKAVITDLDEIKKLSNDEKNALITKTWDELTGKLSAEQMILLLQTLNAKPELADKAIQLVKAGMI
jgi:hypothetical protein